MKYDKFEPLGVVFVLSNQACLLCGGKLFLWRDRQSRLAVYKETEGTLVGSHLSKFCHNYRSGCKYIQHYGYHTQVNQSISHYDKNWSELPYLISTGQTAFELMFLRRFDIEILIGELSYNRRARFTTVLMGTICVICTTCMRKKN